MWQLTHSHCRLLQIHLTADGLPRRRPTNLTIRIVRWATQNCHTGKNKLCQIHVM